MHEDIAEDGRWVKKLPDVDVVDWQEPRQPAPSGNNVASVTRVSFRNRLVGRIASSLPRTWLPVALRGLMGIADYLPANIRYRLRQLGVLRPDMGEIERDYPSWIEKYDRIDADARSTIMADIAHTPHPPLISVLMPVFNPSPDHLLAAVASVRDQLYPWWELCIADDASTDPAIGPMLQDAAASDRRIKLVHRAQNGHISAASNSALGLATGLFVALLDHDDVLPAHALYEVAARIVAEPNIDILYSDEDHIDEHGRRSHPYFKPGWNAELMLGQNLINHLGVYRRSLVEQIGGFRIGFEGSQDYDLALRMVAQTQPDRIAHIPRVLYHWRQGGSGRTFSQASLDRCIRAGRQAIQEFIARDRPGARTEPAPSVTSWTRIVYPMPEPAPLVSVIVMGRASADAVSACLEGLLNRTDYPALEILVPAGGTPSQDKRVRCLPDSTTLNQAAELAEGSLLLLLDAGLDPNGNGWLRDMVSRVTQPGVGCVGAKLLGSDGTVRHAGIAMGGANIAFTPFVGQFHSQTGYFGHLQLARDVTAVSSDCMLVHRQRFVADRGRDETLAPALLADLELCLKLADCGCRTVWTPYAELTFRNDKTSHRRLPPSQDLTRMRQRWGRRLDADRFWSANLSSEAAEPRLAFPPRAG